MTDKYQTTINQVNAVVSFLPENERELLPKKLIDFLHNKSSELPENSLDLNRPFEEQSFTEEAFLILYGIKEELRKLSQNTL